LLLTCSACCHSSSRDMSGAASSSLLLLLLLLLLVVMVTPLTVWGRLQQCRCRRRCCCHCRAAGVQYTIGDCCCWCWWCAQVAPVLLWCSSQAHVATGGALCVLCAVVQPGSLPACAG
jgi:hypothetical protein